MELLVWHANLGSDDEQAEEDEVRRRLLYEFRCGACGGDRPRAFGDPAGTTSSSSLHSLLFLQGVVAFARSLKREDAPEAEDLQERVSVTLDGRKFLVLEVETNIFIALGMEWHDELVRCTELICSRDASLLTDAELTPQEDHRVVLEAIVRGLYDMFCLFHGTIDRNLRLVENDERQQLTAEAGDGGLRDGMNILLEIQSTHKRLRKLEHRIENLSTVGADDADIAAGQAHHQTSMLEIELTQVRDRLDYLTACSPAVRLWALFDDLFPTLIKSAGVQHPSCFADLNGFGYFPMDQPLFLEVQSFLNDLRSHLDGGGLASSALFFKGNLLWSSEDAVTLRALYTFLRLREEHGMDFTPHVDMHDPLSKSNAIGRDGDDMGSVSVVPSKGPSVWMKQPYQDTFLPVWSSKTAYAECAVSQTSASFARRSARSIHKLSSRSISAMVADTMLSSPQGTPTISQAISDDLVAQGKALLSSWKTRVNSISFRNVGLMLCNGYFARPAELPKGPAFSNDAKIRSAPEAIWNPEIFLIPSEAPSGSIDMDACRRRVVVWHDAGLTMVTLFRTSKNSIQPPLRSSVLEKLADYFDSSNRFSELAELILARYLDTVTRGLSSSSQRPVAAPPFIYLNRVNLAFKLQQVPRLLKTSDDDLFPIPPGLLSRYFPRHSLELVNRLHTLLEEPRGVLGGNHDLCVRTLQDGWVYAKKSRTSQRDLYVFLDTKVPSVADLSHSLTVFLNDHFGNVFF